jgi:hypothetical protein
MTMILSTRREPCAILAAERLWGNASSAPSFERKLVLHSLPLGFGLAGYVWVPIGGIWATTILDREPDGGRPERPRHAG